MRNNWCINSVLIQCSILVLLLCFTIERKEDCKPHEHDEVEHASNERRVEDERVGADKVPGEDASGCVRVLAKDAHPAVCAEREGKGGDQAHRTFETLSSLAGPTPLYPPRSTIGVVQHLPTEE